MFQEYQKIIDDAKQQEKDLIKTFQISKEQLSLKIKTKLEEEQTRITTKCELKDYSPIEFRDEMDRLTTEFKNLIIEQENSLTTLKIETNKKLSPLLGNKIIKEFYKIILSGANHTYHIKVWFTLIDRPEIGCKAGEVFKLEQCVWNNSGNDQLGSGKVMNSFAKSKNQNLHIPNLHTSSYYINDNGILHDPKASPQFLSPWNIWVKKNKVLI